MTLQIETTPLHRARIATHQLSLQEKAQLISELAQEIARASSDLKASNPKTDGLKQFKAFISEFHQTYPNADVANQLQADREGRNILLIEEKADVHP